MIVSLMPRDILRQWNSTLDLLEYALKHQKVVDLVTQWHETAIWAQILSMLLIHSFGGMNGMVCTPNSLEWPWTI